MPKTRPQLVVVAVLLTPPSPAALFFCFTVFRPRIFQGEHNAKILIDFGTNGAICDMDLDGLESLAILGFLLGQASLLALWGDRTPLSSYFRIPLALLGVAGLCVIFHQYSKEMHLTELRPADYFYLFGIHALAIILVLSLLRIRNVLFEKRQSKGSQENAEKAQFSIRFLLLWTTAIALLLGLGRLALSQPNGMPTNNCLDFLITVGICNAVFALLAIAVVLSRRSRRSWNLFVPSLILLMLLIQPTSWWEIFLIDSKTNPFRDLTFSPFILPMRVGFLILANVQILTILFTLVPLRLCGMLGGTQKPLPE